MRTREELESMNDHPAGSGKTREVTPPVATTIEAAPTPYRRFFDALEALNDDAALYGSGSIEVRVARTRLEQARNAVVTAWRRERNATAAA